MKYDLKEKKQCSREGLWKSEPLALVILSCFWDLLMFSLVHNIST